MRLAVIVPFSLLFVFSPLKGRSESASFTPTPSASPLVIQNLTTTYRFHQDAVWARLDSTVRDHQDGFNLNVASDTALSGWILRDTSTNTVVQKSGLGNVKTFTAEIQRSFKDGYRLTVFVKADQDQVPIVMNLTPQEGKKESNGIADSYVPDFEDNPDHSYNLMVKNLYKQATQAYEAGDKNSALKYLNQAVEVDPTQPQVQSFKKMLEAGSSETGRDSQAAPGAETSKDAGVRDESKGESPEDLASQAKKAAAMGERSKARLLYEKALRLNPDQKEWASELDRLNLEWAQEKFESAIKSKHPSEARSAFNQLKALAPDNPKISEWKKELDALQTPAPKSQADAQADGLFNQGLTCYAKDDWAGAKQNWEQALKLKPNHLQAANNLERLLELHPELK